MHFVQRHNIAPIKFVAFAVAIVIESYGWMVQTYGWMLKSSTLFHFLHGTIFIHK